MDEEAATPNKPLSRAERRRAERGIPEVAIAGRIGCKFCQSTRGTFYKSTNRFVCDTKGCKGASTYV